MAEITPNKLRMIRTLLESGRTYEQVAKTVGVAKSTINRYVCALKRGLNHPNDYSELVVQKNNFESFAHYMRCRRILKKKKTKQQRFEESFATLGANPTIPYQPEDIVEQRDLEQKLEEMVEHLPPSLKEIVFCRFFRDMTLEQTREHLGIGTSSSGRQLVMIREAKAVKKLRYLAHQRGMVF